MRQTAAVDAQKCDPASCDSGACAAIPECPRKIIKQEAPYEVPYIAGDPSVCRGCFKCLKACPRQAIAKV
ncbi:MAG: 4Fe-4S ferredoxin [Chloroflexi bacterium]|nr:4Fe-4S ferredoxin [Chloroflexota bacterium]